MPTALTRTNMMRDATVAAGMIVLALLGLVVAYDFIEADDGPTKSPPSPPPWSS